MKRVLILSIVVLIPLFFSCQKSGISDLFMKVDSFSEEDETLLLKDAEVESSEELADYEVDFFTAHKNGLNEYGNNWRKIQMGKRLALGGRYLRGHCPDITVDSADTGFPKTITLNYGDGTKLSHGKVLRGKIIIYISDPPFTNGGTREITYEDFYIDSLNISGNKIMTFIGDNITTRLFSSTSKLLFTFADGSTISRKADKIRQWIAGLETEFQPADDIINITGQVTTIGRDGNEMQKVIKEALVKTGACRFIIEGIVDFIKNGEKVAVLDYGDGECDNKAFLTRNGETKVIYLWKRK